MAEQPTIQETPDRAATPGFRLQTSLPPESEPIRGELFSLPHLEEHARHLAQIHQVSPNQRAERQFLSRFHSNSQFLTYAYQTIARAVQKGEIITPAAEWLLDNYYVVQEQLREIRKDLPRSYYLELPKLISGSLAGYPRVYALALELIRHTDSSLDEVSLTRFVNAYQTVATLTIGEVWAVPIMLRLGLVENLRCLAAQMLAARQDHNFGDVFISDLLAQGSQPVPSLTKVLAERASRPLTPAFVVYVVERLRDQGPDLAPCGQWLEEQLQAQGTSVDEIIRQEHQRQAATQVSIGNAITSMRLLSNLDWPTFFENTSLVESALRQDPSETYSQMDFATRDRYRHVVEGLAKRTRLPEINVARQVLELASQAPTTDSRRRHIGFYLVGKGLPLIEAAIRYRPTLIERLKRLLVGHPSLVYLGSIFFLTVLGAAVLVLHASAVAGSTWQVVVAGLLAILPASDLAVNLVNFLVTTLMYPRVLPKLELKEGLPSHYRTAVVVPTLLSSEEGVRTLLERLEIHYVANPDAPFTFVLLTDWADASQEEISEDAQLVALAVSGIRDLNVRHGVDGKGPFLLLHRLRRWNPAQSKWMGWERKRGKLLEFNRLLRGAEDTTFKIKEGDLARLKGVRYVITLDTDTQLPRGAARRLVGTLAHPLNKALFDPSKARVVEGYSILQPRVDVSLPSANRSAFARIFSGNPGMDPYTTAVSDVYEDLFGEGTFTGKGIYEVDSFEAAIGPTFPENHILSHDLIEGCYARAGLVTDIVVFDEFPTRYHSYARRLHRWVRGDWQILPWLFSRVPSAAGPCSNPLPVIARWKILDNLRRSLVGPALLAFLMAGWMVLPGPAWVWTLAALLVPAFPIFAQLTSVLLTRPTSLLNGDSLRDLWRELRLTGAQFILMVAFLPHMAYLMADAIIRTLVRLTWTRRLLLEWETASATERRLANQTHSSLTEMWFGPAGALILGFLLPFRAYGTALPLLFIWLFSPAIAYAVSRPITRRQEAFSSKERLALRRIARKTWSFFEKFVTADEHWLPPDNFQEQPREDIAHRISPTNEGLFLVSGLAAHDFGFLGCYELIRILEQNLEQWEKLDRYRGHFYNWYDTQTLQPLLPRYVSTVDSGNLAACLLTLRQGLLEKIEKPLLGESVSEGLADSARLIPEALARVHPPGARFVHPGLDQLEKSSQQILDLLQLPPSDLSAWNRALEELEKVCLVMPESLRIVKEDIHLNPEELDARVQGLVHHVQGLRKEFQTLLPWIPLLVSRLGKEKTLNPQVGVNKERNGSNGVGNSQYLRTIFSAKVSLQDLAHFEENSKAGGNELFENSGILSSGSKADNSTWSDSLTQSIRDGAAAASSLIKRYENLANHCEALALGMDFSFLYDKNRRLFSIGYNSQDGRLDRSYYDLLASEARLASFLAIGKGDVEQAHWFHLGRQLTQAGGGKTLLSWGGTMFEYLMPVLFTRLFPNTLLDESCRVALERQMIYGKHHGVPWGISESAYADVSAGLHYHYQSFGVPGLGLKRGLSKDLVISPYSTALALMVQPRAALANFEALAKEGAEGTWGYYDAVDYTGSRVPSGQSCAVVRCFMAHHQGMSLLALANGLFQNCIQQRFHAQTIVRATELLLQERLPQGISLVQPPEEEGTSAPLVREAVRPVSRRLTTADTPVPRTHLLSNGEYCCMVTNAGTGYSQCRGIMLTRWRPDTTCDSWGYFIYIRDLRSNTLWSAASQPFPQPPSGYEVIFSSDKAEYRRRDGEVETHLEVAVSPEVNAEVRQVTLTNYGKRARDLELTSYAEVVLATYGTDLAHPAFHKLFIQTEYIANSKALLAMRRPRAANQETVWFAHVVAVEGNTLGPVEYETDRALFLGRGRTPATPVALEPGVSLSNTTGAVLDPIVSLRARVRVGAGQSVRLAFSLAMGKSRDEVLGLADQFHDSRVILRTLELAWAHSQVKLRHLNLSPGDAHLFQRLASPLFYPDPSRRAPAKILGANRQGQQGLWRYGISGDWPIFLVRLTEPGHSSLVREALLAHEFLRTKCLTVDLVILNDQPASYLDPVQEEIHGFIQGMGLRGLLEKPGGIFVLRGSQIPESDRTLLQAAASIYLLGERGNLAKQLEQSQTPSSLPLSLVPRTAGTSAPYQSQQPNLFFANGLGGFEKVGREYIVFLKDDQWTPAPWINVIANPRFGFLVSEVGSGYTWSENSRENKLTPWANDPLADPPGEALYLRDEDTGELWSPTPLPIRDVSPYLVRHGQGYSQFEHQAQGIGQELLLAVGPEDPVKFYCLKIRNLTNKKRRLSATLYVDWVLGVSREQTQLHVATEIEEETGALLARNPYNLDFGNRVAFSMVLAKNRTVTGDRTEFFGRNGSWSHPAALTRIELSGRTGAGMDPGGAVQTKMDLAPNQEIEVIFLLGQADHLSEARELLDRYQQPKQVHEAIAQAKILWDEVFETIQIKTPNLALDLLFNRWLLYQVLSCRVWGRSALYQSGGAFGYRDQLQDVMALVYSQPQIAREQILRAASRQYELGDVQHWWHPPMNRGIRTHFADDYLWLPLVTCHYLQTTGDQSVLDEKVPFLHSPPLDPQDDERYEMPEVSNQVDSLYGHCLRSIDHGFRFGQHGLPLMGCGDWNDGMNRVGAGGKGESVWVGWFLIYILERFTPLVESRGDKDRASYYRTMEVKLRQTIEEHAWDGGWYRRAFFDDGTPLGSAANEECQIDSLTQSWAVIAGGDPDHARKAMQAVDERLVRRADQLILLFTPPFDKTPHDPGYIKGYLPGVRENGGQYTHAALWVVQAFALMGEGNRAWELLDLLNPINHSKNKATAAVYKVEPYVVAADLYSRPPHVGRGGWTWYTGSAAWMYRVALESLFGFRLQGSHLTVDPCIPALWPGFQLTYRRGKTIFRISVENPNHVQHGVLQTLYDGQEQPGNKISLQDDGNAHEIKITMG